MTWSGGMEGEVGGGSRGRGYVYTYNWFTLWYSRNTQHCKSIILQLKKKRERELMQSTHFICNCQSTYNERKRCSLLPSITRWISLWDQDWCWECTEAKISRILYLACKLPFICPNTQILTDQLVLCLLYMLSQDLPICLFLWVGRYPGEGNGSPLQYSCWENPMDKRSLVGCSPWGRKRVTHNLVTKQQQQKSNCSNSGFLELWCWRRLLRVPWTARRSNQFFLKEISPEYSLKGLMLKLKL